MRLFEAIIEANHRAAGGDKSAGLRPADHESELPIVALSCIDPRLNPLLPEVLGIPEEYFIWLRNAGNIITSPLSSTMRSLALACAVKGGKEIAIIGHSDCQVCKTTVMQVLERFKALGVERHHLPDNITEYFGMFASEQQNVIKACDLVRRSPLIGPNVPVHGVVVDIQTGRLEWIVNGYQTFNTVRDRADQVARSKGQTVDALRQLADFKLGEMRFPEIKIGETVTKTTDWLADQAPALESKIGDAATKAAAEWISSKLPGPDNKIGDAVAKAATNWLEQKLDKMQAKPIVEEAGAPPERTAASIAEKVVKAVAKQHWPTPPEAPPPIVASPSPTPPAKIPLPPRIRPRMQIKKPK